MSNTNKEKNAQVSTHAAAGTKLATTQTNTIQVFADYSVWDTVANKYLTEGKDFDARNLFRV